MINDKKMEKEMNVKDIFWNLVSNKFMPEFDYYHAFSFQTVYYFSSHSYCLCECSFEHEYLEYLSGNGDLDKEMYDKTLESILKGKCSHVNKVDEIYTRRTNISAIHIAAAIGTEEAIIAHNKLDLYLSSGIFKLSPYMIAILKERMNIVQLLQPPREVFCHDDNVYKEILYSHKSQMEERQYLEIESISLPVYCVRKRNRLLLKTILNTKYVYTQVSRAFEQAFKHNNNDLEDDLLEYIAHTDDSLMAPCTRLHFGISRVPTSWTLKCCAVSAIVYDQPRLLQEILPLLYRIFNCKNDAFLSAACTLLNRTECGVVVKQSLGDSNFKIPKRVLLYMGLILLKEGYDREHNTEIQAKLWEVCSFPGDGNITRLNRSLFSHPEAVKTSLQLGADVDNTLTEGKTPLLCLLEERANIPPVSIVRQTIGLILNENPSLNLNKTAVELAIQLDEYLEGKNIFGNLHGNFLIDSEMHSLLGVNYDVNDALNYFGPLLIENGFPVTQQTLYDGLDKSLSSVERAYIRQCLAFPRSLKLSCRDVIRKHFKRRQLHIFVELSEMPTRIKNFILLNDLRLLN